MWIEEGPREEKEERIEEMRENYRKMEEMVPKQFHW